MSRSTLAQLLRALLYEWVAALWRFVRLLRSRRRPRTPGSGHRPAPRFACVPIDHPAYVRPDPLIYSQGHLAARGLAVTWDNPDIELFRAGVPVSSSALEAGTTYEVAIRIWNNSTDAPAVAMPVHLSFLSFGIGTEKTAVGTAEMDVGVKGSPNQPVIARIPWTTPAEPGHYCLLVELDPVDDSDRSNNVGQENTDVAAAQSPAEFKFTLRNDTGRERRYRFEVDAYRIPPLPECREGALDSDAVLRRHRRGAHPLPSGFAVKIEPANPTLAAAAEITVEVTVEPPSGFAGSQVLNVNGFHDAGFAGGVTLTVVKVP